MSFLFQNAALDGVKIIEPDVFADERGCFFESYKQSEFRKNGIDANFIQDNNSLSAFGVLRGLHYQKNPHCQAKLIRVLHGRIWNVLVDLRQGSPSFHRWFAVELSAENRRMLFVPHGFANGFFTLSEQALVHYKADREYCREAEGGIRFDDPALAISWPEGKYVLSPKDLSLPFLANADCNFVYGEK